VAVGAAGVVGVEGSGEHAPVVEREPDGLADPGTDFVIGHGCAAFLRV
jgi:hypothetical protein